MDKKGFQIAFSWLFAIIVGGAILVLAVLVATKILGIGGAQVSAETQKSLEVIMNNIESGLETSLVTSFSLPRETQIVGECYEEGPFGKQIIRVSQKNFGKWSKPISGASTSNRYVFLSNPAEGKIFYIFSKQFEFPFKVANLIYLTSASTNYCFVDAPPSIKEELTDLKRMDPKLNIWVDDCPQKSLKVCFGSSSCEINVDYGEGVVKKRGEKAHFVGDALMYGAIFSDKENYECQIKRLMARTKELAEIYMEKENIIASRGTCRGSLSSELQKIKEIASEVQSSEDLLKYKEVIEEIRRKNENSECPLW